MKQDPVFWAIPFYFGAMAVEHAWQRRRPELALSPGAYEPRDTRASLDMGTLSLLAPVVLPPLLMHVTPGRGRWAKVLLATGAAAVVATTAADRFSARSAPRTVVGLGRTTSTMSHDPREPGHDGGPGDRAARTVQRYGGPTAIIAGGVSAATFLASRTDAETMWSKRVVRDLGGGLGPFTLAMVGWDFLYYWSHRLQHEHRYLWSIHVVHHSSEHYNLSTALRQPVADSLGTMVPFGVLSLFGIRPSLIVKARGLNLIWQFWIHTEVVRSLGRAEAVLSTPSAHRVHHGANATYLDKNHGGILILWDRLFGTFTREVEMPRYGLTKNINTFNRWTIATHEFRSMLADVSRSRSWRDRIGHVVARPGWRPSVRAVASGQIQLSPE